MQIKYHKNNTTDRNTRRTGQDKLGTKPKEIGRTKTTAYHYRVAAYKTYEKVPEELIKIKDPKYFKRWICRYLEKPKKNTITDEKQEKSKMKKIKIKKIKMKMKNETKMYLIYIRKEDRNSEKSDF